MKLLLWRKLALIIAVLFGISVGIIIGQYVLLSWVGNLIIDIFQLSPDEAANFYNEFMQNIYHVLKGMG